MSNKYINWAWSLPLKPGPKLVLICLADMCDDNGLCFPKQSTIAKKTGFDRSTVNQHIKTLKQTRLIQQTQQRYRDGRLRSSIYQLNIVVKLLPCCDSQHSEIQHNQVVFHNNRIHHMDPLFKGGIH